MVLLVDRSLSFLSCCLVAACWLKVLDVNVQTVLAFGGGGAIACGLAMRNVAQNLISGILIFLNQSISEGCYNSALVDTSGI